VRPSDARALSKTNPQVLSYGAARGGDQSTGCNREIAYAGRYGGQNGRFRSYRSRFTARGIVRPRAESPPLSLSLSLSLDSATSAELIK